MEPVSIKIDRRRGEKEVRLSELVLRRQTALAVRVYQQLS